MPVEREIKCRMPSAREARARLRRAGGRRAGPRRRERNWVFDFPGASLARAGLLLRLRHSGGEWTLTWKEPVRGPRGRPTRKTPRAKVRLEFETRIEDGAPLRRALLGCGLREAFRYEKWRTRWRLPSGVVAELDETPAGTFVELEGGARAIAAAASSLGVPERDRLTSSYASIWRQRPEGRSGAPMEFR